MYKFKNLKAKYRFLSDVLYPIGKHSIYSKIEPISVVPNLAEGLNFTLVGGDHEQVNRKPLQDFDLIMSQLGHSLYPIELVVLKTGKIKRLKNLEDIKKRWQWKSDEILSTYENAYWVKRYIKMTTENLADEETFMNALCRSNFMQLFFMEEAASQQHIQMYDFPFTGKTISATFDMVKSSGLEYRYQSVLEDADERICSGTGEMRVTYSDKGLPLKVAFLYRIEVAEEGYYTKKTEIELVE